MEGDQGRPLPRPPLFRGSDKGPFLSFAAQCYSNEYPRSRTNFSPSLTGVGWKPKELFLAGLTSRLLRRAGLTSRLLRRAGFTYRCFLYHRLYSRSGHCLYTYLYT